MDTRFNQVDNKLVDLETFLTSRFNQVDTTLSDLKTFLSQRLDTVELTLQTRFNQIELILQTRFGQVDATLSSRFGQLDKETTIIRTLLITPEGRKTAFNKAGLICDGIETIAGNCPTVVNFPP